MGHSSWMLSINRVPPTIAASAMVVGPLIRVTGSTVPSRTMAMYCTSMPPVGKLAFFVSAVRSTTLPSMQITLSARTFSAAENAGEDGAITTLVNNGFDEDSEGVSAG